MSIKIEINNVYNINCLDGMSNMLDDSVDLVIADPPYNLSKGTKWKWDNSAQIKGMGGNWNKVMVEWDDIPLQEYWNFTIAWLKEAKRILKPTGSMWIFGTYHNIGIISVICQILEIEIINEVVWYKRNAFPNLSGRRLTASHESILWCHSGKKREYYFNYDYTKNGNFTSDKLKVPGKQMRTVWDIPNNKEKIENQFGTHPTQKPVRILTRIIDISSKPGDIMLAPFSWSGSECVAAKQNDRSFIGFEINKEYYDISLSRISQMTQDETTIKDSARKRLF